MSSGLPLYHGEDTVTSLLTISEHDQLNGVVYGTVTLTPRESAKTSQTPFGRYETLLQTNPLRTKALTSGTTTALSDILAQVLSGVTWHTMDMHRVLCAFFIGSLLTAPLYHVVYDTLETRWPISKSRIHIALHLAVDQLIAAPVWTVGYCALGAAFDGHVTSSALVERLHADFVNMMLSTWVIYPLVQTLNFALVPARLRVLVLTIVGFFFTCMVSYLFSGQTHEMRNIGHVVVIPFT